MVLWKKLLSALISVVIGTLVFNTEVDGCDELTVYDNPEYLTSHAEYDGTTKYNNNYLKCWILTTNDSNKIVELQATTFDVEHHDSCYFDVLNIYDAATTDSNATFVKKCGYSTFTLYSSDRYLHLTFSTDANIVYRGFRLMYTQTDSVNYNSDDWTTTAPVTTTVDPSGKSALTLAQLLGLLLGGIIIILLISIGLVICVVHFKKAGRINPNQHVTYVRSAPADSTSEPGIYHPGFQPPQAPPPYCSEPPPPYSPGTAQVVIGVSATIMYGQSRDRNNNQAQQSQNSTSTR